MSSEISVLLGSVMIISYLEKCPPETKRICTKDPTHYTYGGALFCGTCGSPIEEQCSSVKSILIVIFGNNQSLNHWLIVILMMKLCDVLLGMNYLILHINIMCLRQMLFISMVKNI